MCCQSFWKRVVAFYLTFGLGVFITDAFYLRSATEFCPISKISETKPISETKNCVSADKNLKYKTLPYNEKEIPVAELETPACSAGSCFKEKNEIKKPDEKAKKQKKEKQAEPQLYIPNKDSAEYQTLLHKENCYESDGRK